MTKAETAVACALEILRAEGPMTTAQLQDRLALSGCFPTDSELSVALRKAGAARAPRGGAARSGRWEWTGVTG